jgi:hypothetical protein
MAIVCVGLIAGCANPQHPIEMPKKPAPAPELAKLNCFVGTWTGTAEMDVPGPAEAEKGKGDAAKPMTFKGGGKYEWALDGMFLKCEGWHDMGEGQKATYVSYIGWDAKAKKYCHTYVSDWGEIGEGWMMLDADGTTFRAETESVDAKGQKSSGEGVMKFVDDKTIEWTWTESMPGGKMKLHGTDRKQP